MKGSAQRRARSRPKGAGGYSDRASVRTVRPSNGKKIPEVPVAASIAILLCEPDRGRDEDGTT